MKRSLRSLGIDFEEIDVDSDPHLRVQFGRDVPVLVAGDMVILHRLTPEAIAKLR